MNLSGLKTPKGQTHSKKRVGRGMGSGHGKTSARGMKGQHSISGFSQKRGFEGGQMPLHRRLPKRGFTNIFKKDYVVVNVGTLEALEATEFTPESLVEMGVLSKIADGVRVLGTGELTRAITVRAHGFSKPAAEKIEKAGGKAEVIPVRAGGPKPKTEKK